ncbi:putative E2-like enzyme [Mycena belliarum]|uniref:Autophagy-related protein 3 n=1 Tax=Mycena belliarum TaxID=1033014 RepID=A0AAD6XIP0_9AGAR|nr:putative E2-like enzyme [Mycena belliae]
MHAMQVPTQQQYWSSREYLSPHLLTRGVPCLRRATSLAYTDADEDAERLLSFGDSTGADEWVETHAGRKSNMDAANPGQIDDIPDLDGPRTTRWRRARTGWRRGRTRRRPRPKPRPASLTLGQVEVANGNLLQVRTYDVMITYDKYYQTPRIWLIGYDEVGLPSLPDYTSLNAPPQNRTPLTPPQIFQDISADHALKTVTIEAFPHSASLQAASVHPCKHASVMKKVIERMNTSRKSPSAKDKKKWFGRKVSGTGKDDKGKEDKGEEEEVEGMRVDFYLVVFLKFIASIVPTIEVDSTASF